MIIKYLHQVIDTGDVGSMKSYYKFGSPLGIVFGTSTGGATTPGNLVFDGKEMKYYDSKQWIYLRDISGRLDNAIDKQNAFQIGDGDSRPAVDMRYPLIDFHRSVVNTNGVYTPPTSTSKYLSTDNSGVPIWKQWSLTSWSDGGDPTSVWSCRINFNIPYIRWGGHLTFSGYAKFSKGWNVGFANNSLRVVNVHDPIAAGDACNKRYLVNAVNTISTSTASVVNSSTVDSLHSQLTSLFNAAKNDSNHNRLRILKTIVQRYG